MLQESPPHQGPEGLQGQFLLSLAGGDREATGRLLWLQEKMLRVW